MSHCKSVLQFEKETAALISFALLFPGQEVIPVGLYHTAYANISLITAYFLHYLFKQIEVLGCCNTMCNKVSPHTWKVSNLRDEWVIEGGSSWLGSAKGCLTFETGFLLLISLGISLLTPFSLWKVDVSTFCKKR